MLQYKTILLSSISQRLMIITNTHGNSFYLKNKDCHVLCISLCCTMLAGVRLKTHNTQPAAQFCTDCTTDFNPISSSSVAPEPLWHFSLFCNEPSSDKQNQPQANSDQSGWQWTTGYQLIWHQAVTSAVLCFLPQRVTGQTGPSAQHELTD